MLFISHDLDVVEYLCDRVVVLCHCTWRFKKTGKVVSTPKADSWRLADGKAVEYFEYYDTAQVHAAVQ